LGLQRSKNKIIGFILVLTFLFSAYTLVVQAVQEFNNRSLIEQLSLFGSNDADGNGTQFYLGETVSICACVSAGNVYSVTVYGENGSVFCQNGWIHGSEAVVQVPLDPPAFRANESYVVTFSASIPVYPILGAFVTDEKMAAFAVLASSTQLNLNCDYDGTSHWLSVSAALVTGQGAPVANKTIRFDLQLNTSSYIQDRGWLPLGSATTGADGLASYVTGCDVFSGIQYVRAEFAGDGDYSGSANTTQFTVVPLSPVIQSVNVTSSTRGTQYAVEVTDSSGYPLMGKTVAVADKNSTDPEYAVTDAEGTALVWLNGSESSSDPVRNVTVLSDTFTSQSELTCGSSSYVNSSSEAVIHLPSSVPRASQSTEGLTVSILPSRPCAVLPTLVTASYRGSINGWAYFSFLLDGVRQLSQVAVLGQGNVTYNVPLVWCSDVVGNHSITVSVSGAISAEDSVAVDPAYCPDNLQLFTPQVIYGNQLQFSLVFTEPYPYKPNSTALFSSFNTAPTCTWNGTTCKVDVGIIHSSVTLSINAGNTSLYRQTVTTNADGVASINDSITMTRPNLTCDFMANTSRNSNFAFFNLTRVVNYSDVGVSASAGVNKNLTLSCSVGGGNATSSQVYVGAESPVEATANLFGMPVYDAPVNITFAEFVPTYETWNKTGISTGSMLTIPARANFLCVACVYNNSCLDADIARYKLMKSQNWDANCDGVVNIQDVDLIQANWGKNIKRGANPMADINHDDVVNILDVSVIQKYWGQRGSYLPSFGAVANFTWSSGTPDPVPVDSAGCVAIPWEAQGGKGNVSFTLNGRPVGAYVEFFSATNSSGCTDSSGAVKLSWTPSVAGDYLVEVKLPQRFNATVSQNEPTSVSAPVCTIEYVQVVKRPVTLSLTPNAGPSTYSLDIPVCADASVWGGEPNTNFGGMAVLPVCPVFSLHFNYNWPQGGGEAFAFLNFNLFSYLKNAYISSATLTLSVNDSGYNHAESDYVRNYSVYCVGGPWSEGNITYNTKPRVGSGLPHATQAVDLSNSPSEVTWDVTSVLQWLSNTSSAFVYGFVIRDDTPDVPFKTWSDSPYIEFNSHREGHPGVLHVEFSIPTIFALNATDALGEPAQYVPFWWSLNGTYAGSDWTDDAGQGLVDVDVPLKGSVLGVYNITAFTNETDWYLPAMGSWTYDNRWSSNITCQEGVVVNATVYQQTSLAFRLFCQQLCGMNLTGLLVHFFLNGVGQGSGSTNANGQVSFTWTPTQAKTYVVAACFEGTGVFSPCNVSVCVTAQVVPVGVAFSVPRVEFAPGTPLTLTANLTNLKTGGVMTNFMVQFCYNNSAGKTGVLCTSTTGGSGVATYPWTYPNNGTAYALYAQAGTTNGNQPQNMASSPVQLTVGLNTTLLLSVSRQNSSDTHTFMARLVNDARSGLSGRTLTLTFNGTQKYNATTNQNGNATWTLPLSPQKNDSATTYNVAVSFWGDAPVKSATAYLITPNGTRCAICTTIQYNTYKPSANSTSILVWPQTTTGETTLVNMAAMQQKAESEGLQIWGPDSWSIFPPFFKLHVKVGIDWLAMNIHTWIGLGFCGVDSYDGLGRLLQAGFLNVSQQSINVLVSAALTAITATVVLYFTNLIAASISQWTPPIYAGVLIAYSVIGAAALWRLDSIPDVTTSRILLFAVGATLLSLLIGAIAAGGSAPRLITSIPFFVMNEVTGGPVVFSAVKSLVNSVVVQAISYLSGWTSAVFRDPLMWLFAGITGALAVTAIFLGATRR
jgi:hypothetical protein